MGLGRGSAISASAVLCLMLLLHSEMADAATYTVGGSAGWTFNAVGWPKGKRFRAGDTLGNIYNYYLPIHFFLLLLLLLYPFQVSVIFILRVSDTISFLYHLEL